MQRKAAVANILLRALLVAAAAGTTGVACGRRSEPSRDLPLVVGDVAAVPAVPDATGTPDATASAPPDAAGEAGEIAPEVLPRIAFWPLPPAEAIGRPLSEFHEAVPPGSSCRMRARPDGTTVRCRLDVLGQPVDAVVQGGTDGRIATFELHLVTDPSPIDGEGRTLTADEVGAWAQAIEDEATRILGTPLPPEAGDGVAVTPEAADVSQRRVGWRSASRPGCTATLDIVLSPSTRLAIFRLDRSGDDDARPAARGVAP